MEHDLPKEAGEELVDALIIRTIPVSSATLRCTIDGDVLPDATCRYELCACSSHYCRTPA